MVNILVFVKQVYQSADLKVERSTKTLHTVAGIVEVGQAIVNIAYKGTKIGNQYGELKRDYRKLDCSW